MACGLDVSLGKNGAVELSTGSRNLSCGLRIVCEYAKKFDCPRCLFAKGCLVVFVSWSSLPVARSRLRSTLSSAASLTSTTRFNRIVSSGSPPKRLPESPCCLSTNAPTRSIRFSIESPARLAPDVNDGNDE